LNSAPDSCNKDHSNCTTFSLRAQSPRYQIIERLLYLGSTSSVALLRQNLAPQVLQMIEKGLSYRAIAKRLNMSRKTVMEIVKRSRCADRVGA
jgi:DNA-binding NarL/FixJ family response regulator